MVAMPPKKVKKVNFFRASLLVDGRKRNLDGFDWKPIVDAAMNAPSEQRVFDDVICEAANSEGNLLLGLHAPLNTDFLTTLDTSTGSIIDLMATKSDDVSGAPNRLFNSSAVLFFPVGATFALVSANTSAPRQAKVVSLLDRFAPQGQGKHWKCDPLYDRSKIAELRKARGLIEFSKQVETQRDLFSDTHSQGLASVLDEIAEKVGGDVEVNLSIKLTQSANDLSTQQRFLRSVTEGLTRLVTRGSRAKARAIFPDGFEEELDLVEHRLYEEFDLDTSASERAQFSELQRLLVTVRAEMETRVRANLNGDDHAEADPRSSN